MKKDKLERFVRDNHEAFDNGEPSLDLWKRIEAGLDKSSPERPQFEQADLSTASPFLQVHKNRSLTSGRQIGWPTLDWRVAASIAVLLLAGCFFYMNQRYGVAHQPELVAANPTYAKEVVHYTQLIDDKRAELKQMTENEPALYQEFATDLNRLENSYKSLKADLPKNPNQELLIQAMIQNLQLQINLLNEQLRVIERIKQQTNETNPV